MNKDFLKSLVKEQKQKFLMKATGIEREILVSLGELLKLPHAIIISGMRRTGKSTLLLQLAKKYFTTNPFYYINFDDERWVGFEAKDFNLVYEALLETEGDAKTFLIDEIQNIKGFELFVRRFIDDGFKFVVTGSNSDMLSQELGTRLTGRHVVVNIFPFSWVEFLKIKSVNVPDNKVVSTKEKTIINTVFDDYLIYGGMPEYALYKRDEILMQVYNDLIIKDIAVRFNINNINVLREFYMFMLTNCTSRFSYNSLLQKFGIQSSSTIINYLDYLELTFFAKQVRKFDFSLQKSLKNDKKLYIIDNGFISLLSQTFTRDTGKLFENMVFNHLNKTSDVFYYAGKGECDFITTQNRQVKGLYQVCYMLNDANKDREIKGLLEAMDFCRFNTSYLITSENSETLSINGQTIFVVPAWKWMLGE